MCTISQTDILVNVVSPNLNLNQTHVSQLVLAAAGSGIQDECRQKLPPSGVVPYGQFVVTSAGKISTCQRICHGVLDRWNSASGSAEEVGVAAA
jgi:O-acetyl-ADP-ribose deacetylase (regulator of RNase III)